MNIKDIKDDVLYDVEIDGEIIKKTGKELKPFIVTMRRQIIFEFEQVEALLTENKTDARNLQPRVR